MMRSSAYRSGFRLRPRRRFANGGLAALLAAALATAGCSSASPPATPSDALQPGPLDETALPEAQRRAARALCHQLLDWVVRGDRVAFDSFVEENRLVVEALRGTPASAEQATIAAQIAERQRSKFEQATRLLARDLELAGAAPSTPIASRFEAERFTIADDALFFDLYAPLQFDHGKLGWRVANFCLRGETLVLCGAFDFEVLDDR